MAEMQEDVWLLQSKVNPFPVAAHLSLSGGRLVLTLTPAAKDGFTGWIEKAIDDPAVKAKAAAGETVTLFDIDPTGLDIKWPKQFMGSAMQVPTDQREWLVSLVYPSGSLYSNVKMFQHRKQSKAWKEALAAG
jgi:hypothetical protein